MMKYPAFKALGFVCLIAGVCAYGQSVFSGNIQGVVSDPSGSAVPGAAVTLRNLDTGVETAATTSTSGNYRFSSLPPGRYTLHIETAGFRPAEEGVTLDTNQTQGINITLALATSTQAVTNVSEAPPLDTDDSRIQATLNSATVRELPALNRNLWDVLTVHGPLHVRRGRQREVESISRTELCRNGCGLLQGQSPDRESQFTITF